jgi:hypothetical protein
MRPENDWKNPHSFEEALEFLKENWIDYEVSVGGHQGALMTRQTWLESVADHGFIDYDGYGNQLTAEGKYIGGTIKPSQASTILPDTAYILWYNR